MRISKGLLAAVVYSATMWLLFAWALGAANAATPEFRGVAAICVAPERGSPFSCERFETSVLFPNREDCESVTPRLLEQAADLIRDQFPRADIHIEWQRIARVSDSLSS